MFLHTLQSPGTTKVCQGWGLTCLSALFSAPAELERASLLLGGDEKALPEALHHPATPPGVMQLGKAQGPQFWSVSNSNAGPEPAAARGRTTGCCWAVERGSGA